MWAVAGLLVVSVIASGFTAYACNYVIESFQNSNTMALLITDAGVKSDDKNLERQLSVATLTLTFLRDIGYAVLIGCGGVGVCVGIRKWRDSRVG
jgi:hypothetical protein